MATDLKQIECTNMALGYNHSQLILIDFKILIDFSVQGSHFSFIDEADPLSDETVEIK